MSTLPAPSASRPIHQPEPAPKIVLPARRIPPGTTSRIWRMTARTPPALASLSRSAPLDHPPPQPERGMTYTSRPCQLRIDVDLDLQLLKAFQQTAGVVRRVHEKRVLTQPLRSRPPAIAALASQRCLDQRLAGRECPGQRGPVTGIPLPRPDDRPAQRCFPTPSRPAGLRRSAPAAPRIFCRRRPQPAATPRPRRRPPSAPRRPPRLAVNLARLDAGPRQFQIPEVRCPRRISHACPRL